MKILMDTGGIAYTNCFLVVDDASGDCVLFDAPDHTVANLLTEIDKNKWNLIGLWLTHGHFDHVADHKIVCDRFPNAKVLMHRLDEPKLIDPRSKIFPLPFTIPPGKADAYVEDNQTLHIGQLEVKVIFTPGHSPGHVSYYFPQEGVLVGGDLIIGGAVGRTDLPDSNHDQLEASVRRIMKLPMETKLLPGHGGVATLQHELDTNPYVNQAIGNS